MKEGIAQQPSRAKREKLSKEFLDSGHLVLFPELWELYGEQQKDEIRVAAIQAIDEAYKTEDYATVGELQRALLNFLGKDAALTRDNSPVLESISTSEFVTNESIERIVELPRVERDLRALTKEEDWTKEIKKLERKRDSKYKDWFVCVGGELKQLDPLRFVEEVKPITDDEWNSAVREIKHNMPFYYRLSVMAGLKQLDSKRFDKEKFLDEDFWKTAKEMVDEYLQRDSHWLLKVFSDLYALDPIKAKKLCSLTEDKWNTLLDTISSKSRLGYSIETAFSVAQAQCLKPEGTVRDAVFTEEEWEKTLQELKRLLEYGTNYEFMYYFTKLKDLKIG